MTKYLSNGWKITNVDNVEDWENAIEKNVKKAKIKKAKRKESYKKKK